MKVKTVRSGSQTLCWPQCNQGSLESFILKALKPTKLLNSKISTSTAKFLQFCHLVGVGKVSWTDGNLHRHSRDWNNHDGLPLQGKMENGGWKMCWEEMKCLKGAFRYYLFENKNCVNHVISTYILLTQIIERCPVLIYSLCLVPKITVYSECGEWSVTLKQQTLHLRKISKSQWSHLLMFLTTRQLYFKRNISSAWGCAITFTWASSGKKDVILRPIVQMGKWSLRVVQTHGNTLALPLQVGLHLWDLLQEGGQDNWAGMTGDVTTTCSFLY